MAAKTAPKMFIPLENNPEVMTKLAHQLGLSSDFSFQDIYSFDPEMLSFIPRPATALLFIYPETEASNRFQAEHYVQEPEYLGSGPDEPVLFYHQIIGNACGLIGLLHCITNGAASSKIRPGSDLDILVKDTIPLTRDDRAQLLNDSDMLEKAHAAAAQTGDTEAPPLGEHPHHAFIAFVTDKNNHVWELEGQRKGPVDLGPLVEGEDMLSENALNLGPRAFIKREEAAGSGTLRFSCVALCDAAGW